MSIRQVSERFRSPASRPSGGRLFASRQRFLNRRERIFVQTGIDLLRGRRCDGSKSYRDPGNEDASRSPRNSADA
jgi:hypothetical protein